MGSLRQMKLGTSITVAALLLAAASDRNAVNGQTKSPPPPPPPLRPNMVLPPVTPQPVLVLPDVPTKSNVTFRAKPISVTNVPTTPSPATETTPPVPVDEPRPSQVFPDGNFPTFPNLSNPQPFATESLPKTVASVSQSGKAASEVQNAPGAIDYSPVANLLPTGTYSIDNYLRPVVGPHGYAEYAPLGYEAVRDYQDAPGVPEYMLITPARPVTPEERDRFVTRGLFPGSYLVPGTNTSFRFRGFVRFTGMYDFDPIGTPDIFVVNTIPVPQSVGQNFNMTARPSRIATETWTPTTFRDWTVHTFIEADFFNGPGQAAGGGGNPFRLRHAFVDYGYFRVGQQNSVFMDGNTWPSLVDFQGPVGWVNQRRPGARVTLPIGDQCYWAGGIEQPFSDITTNGLGTGVQDVPDLATHFRYETDLGHVQVSGLARSIGYRPSGGEVTRRSGYGISTGTAFHPWAWAMGTNPLRKSNPSGLERSRLIGQYTFGWGIGRYMLDTVGLGLDGQVDAVTGSFDLPYAAAWVMSYEHWFTEKWMAQATWSETLVATSDGQPAGTYTGAKYVAGSLWYIPVRNLSLGTELLYGERENIDGDRGRAKRLNALVQYNF